MCSLMAHRRAARSSMAICTIAPARPTIIYDTYWRFAAERQAVFFRRLNGNPLPWTEDPILQEYRFTNAYRASDRVSQYLIRHVINANGFSNNPDEMFFRILLFKIFNRIETWEYLKQHLGEITLDTFSLERYDQILAGAMEQGRRIYSNAYIMPSAGSGKPGRKHRMHLALVDRMLREEVAKRLCDAPSMARAFEILRGYPSIGDFLAYQYITDINYSELVDFSEREFVVPGPGARDGLRKCFEDPGGLTEPELIKVVMELQEQEFQRLGLDFQSLWGRPLHLIDCQNLFCEVDKYARVAHPEIRGYSGRTRIKQRYRPRPDAISYWYPPKWGINEQVCITAGKRAVDGDGVEKSDGHLPQRF